MRCIQSALKDAALLDFLKISIDLDLPVNSLQIIKFTCTGIKFSNNIGLELSKIQAK